MDKVLEPLIASPKLALYLSELGNLLAHEKAAREQFYRDMDETDKTEFINGEVIVHSPVKKRHTDCGRRLLILIGGYVQACNLGFVGYEKTLVSLTRNDYEPDLCFFANNQASTLQSEQMLFPAPDFAVEILSPSTEANDRGIKFEDYAAHGVREYWLVDPEADVLEQYLLKNGGYELEQKSKDGHVTSSVIDGLTLPVCALFDDATNLQALQTLLANEKR
jgi:Uma2 family endonuclease